MKAIILIISLLAIHVCKAQNYQLNEDERFVYQVKQLDELIERFNGEDKTLVKEYINKSNPEAKVDRTTLIKTLFNSQKKNWNLVDVKAFITYVNDKSHPVYLNFEDDAWFAEAKCSVLYKGKSEKIHLILKVQKEKNDALKWVFVSAKSGFMPKSLTFSEFLLPAPENTTSNINPISHTTDFMSLDIALNDKNNLINYIARDCRSGDLLHFLQEMDSKNVIFEQVDSITYHFLQIDGWGFTVQKFRRPMKNSGWLVNSLTKMDQKAKESYLISVLNISR
ncbi:hypothetical protein AAE02nite_18280 [Adhaeribacter aerolatus]|uniref:DUF3828 domain-containing protein n=1 Tax=Adhaeribacter aerolatus TaxID=670289 RepID=A0A512AWU3_9BACT|nr:hypothetical protein [Adhaeribacter aerolatus]GEO04164.1 hypothetical protein AAE02nite_18280 [Adhaeribacter aerolatus]